jgi:hypothetical protein
MIEFVDVHDGSVVQVIQICVDTVQYGPRRFFIQYRVATRFRFPDML